MDLGEFVRSWSGTAYRHIPDGSPYGPLDSRFAALAQDNRWNRAGEPTLYLGSDRGVLIGEFTRHFADHRPSPLVQFAHRRLIFAIRLQIGRVIDLRDRQLLDLLTLDHRPDLFLDQEVARATAGFLRHTAEVEAIIAPSMVFLDDLSRFVLVLFLENLRGGLDGVVRRVDDAGTFQLELGRS